MLFHFGRRSKELEELKRSVEVEGREGALEAMLEDMEEELERVIGVQKVVRDENEVVIDELE